MVKHKDTTVGSEVDKLNEQDAAVIISHALSSGRSRDKYISDELIVSLADAYENKRARQVNEWERRQHVAKA
jgi:hypothetical protein